MNEWFLVQTGLGGASWNMAFDEALLESSAVLKRPLLRLYGWTERAATFGYSQKFAEVSAWSSLRPLIRRPTGGGLVPHEADWTYSIAVPPGNEWYELRAEESYRRAHDWVTQSFRKMEVAAELATVATKEIAGRCFIGSEKFDVLANGQKIAGAAQKRNKAGLLIQGSIQPAKEWSRSEWERTFLGVGEKRMEVGWRELTPDENLLERAKKLDAEKYSRREYNERR